MVSNSRSSKDSKWAIEAKKEFFFPLNKMFLKDLNC